MPARPGRVYLADLLQFRSVTMEEWFRREMLPHEEIGRRTGDSIS